MNIGIKFKKKSWKIDKWFIFKITIKRIKNNFIVKTNKWYRKFNGYRKKKHRAYRKLIIVLEIRKRVSKLKITKFEFLKLFASWSINFIKWNR